MTALPFDAETLIGYTSDGTKTIQCIEPGEHVYIAGGKHKGTIETLLVIHEGCINIKVTINECIKMTHSNATKTVLCGAKFIQKLLPMEHQYFYPEEVDNAPTTTTTTTSINSHETEQQQASRILDDLALQTSLLMIEMGDPFQAYRQFNNKVLKRINKHVDDNDNDNDTSNL